MRIKRKSKIYIGAMLVCMLMTGFTAPNVSAMTVSNSQGETMESIAVQLYVYGEELGDDTVVGVQQETAVLVPCERFLKEELCMDYVYDPTAQSIVLTYYGKSVRLTVGSTQAVVDQTTLDLLAAPAVLMPKETGIQDVYIPAQILTEVFQFTLKETQISSTQKRVNFLPPVVYQEEGQQIWYTDSRINTILYNGKQLELTLLMPGIQMDGVMMIPLQEVVGSEAYGGSYSIEENRIVIKRGTIEMELPLSGTQAVVNGETVNMDAGVRHIQRDEMGYDMVPAKFLFEQLGADHVNIDLDKKTITVKKNPGTFLSQKWQADQVSGNYVSKVSGTYKDKKDIFTITCKKTPSVQISHTKTTITITMKQVSLLENINEEVCDTRYSEHILMKQKGNQVVVKIKKQSGVDYVSRYGEGKIIISVGATPVRIAVDCGHGANTPGKRTPPMPCNIDFDGDGVIDVKKGQTIREHQMNVGVGKYLAAELERLGFRVYRSAFGSTDVSLRDRQNNIRKFGAKYSISVHFNAAGTGRTFNAARGVEVYYHDSADRTSKQFAKKVVREMAKGTKQPNRGAKHKVLALCNKKTMNTKASILVECAFMTNLHEAKTMCGSEKFWEETGEEIAKATCQYAGLSYLKK